MDTPTLANHERTPCEIWTRVMGYHRPTSQWNAGKQSEHRERTAFRERPSMSCVPRSPRGSAAATATEVS